MDAKENLSSEKPSVASRRNFLRASLLGSAGAALYPALAAGRVAPPQAASSQHTPAPQPPGFDLEEITIRDLQRKMTSGELTAHAVAEKYLARIDAVDKHGPAINSVIEINPDALSIADGLDKERKAGKVRGPLHGIPVLIKDNIDTADRMMT
ncbi:MAG TPA: amidase family protein, partial [Terriglobales bacterium]|nr:amidase family protein [Terriglobales bacterium]